MSASLEELHKAVRALQDRQEIYDCLARYARGIDRFDRDLVLSAFHPDAIDEHGKFVGNPEEFAEWAISQHRAAHLSHQHCLLNHRCDLDGDSAHAETYFMFVAMNASGKPLTIGGGRYVDRFARRDGKWAIACRVTLRDWAMMDERPDMSDLSSFTSTRASLSDEMRAFMNAGVGAARDRSDPSYARPLQIDPSRRDAYKKLVGGGAKT